jgi:hypothetical protein
MAVADFPLSIAPAVPRASLPAKPARKTALLQLVGGAVTRLALSPDAKHVAYLAGGLLWIAGTDGEPPVMYGPASGTPFWSPDGRSVAAAAPDHRLLRYDTQIRGSANICTVDTNFSGAWSKDGTIVIGLIRDGLFRVPAKGGTLERITSLDTAHGETRHIALQFLPDGRRFLFVAGSNERGRSMLYAGSLDSTERTPIMFVSSNVELASGYLVGIEDSMLNARAFDQKTLRLSGGPFVLGPAPPAETAANASVSLASISTLPR